MRKSRNKNNALLRQELAQNAARLIAVDGIEDYMAAKKKAAMKLGITENKHYPSNREIEAELIQYQQLFQQDIQPLILTKLRTQATRAMRLFSSLNPYLVGPVLTGTAGEYSDIILHIFTDTPESVSIILMDANIPYEECEKRARFSGQESTLFPAFQFFAEDIRIQIVIFPERKKQSRPSRPDSRSGYAACRSVCPGKAHRLIESHDPDPPSSGAFTPAHTLRLSPHQ